MYYSDLRPHKNLTIHWSQMPDSEREKYGDNFWTWLEDEHKAFLDISVRPERWKFEKSEDCMMFILRWT